MSFLSFSEDTNGKIIAAIAAALIGLIPFVVNKCDETQDVYDTSKPFQQESKNTKICETILDRIEEYQKKPAITPRNNCLEKFHSTGNSIDGMHQLYIRENTDLKHAITIAMERTRSQSNLHYLRYIMAPAGTGKSSFFKGDFFNSPWREVEKSNDRRIRKIQIDTSYYFQYFDLPKWFSESDRMPDLVTRDSTVLNMLPGTKGAADSIIQRIFREIRADNNFRNTIYLLDGLDELHSIASNQILKYVGQELEKISDRILAIFVVGRHEGFLPYIEKRRKVLKIDSDRPIDFKAPRYRNIQEVEIRYKDYNNIFDSKISSLDTLILILKDEYLCEAFSILQVSKKIIENASLWAGTKDLDVKQFLFEDMIDRNTDTHRRPSKGDSKYLDAFSNVVISNYITNLNGIKFRVSSEGYVKYSTTEIRIRDLLDRSGLVLRDPVVTPTYQFDPPWVEEYLLERAAETNKCISN